MNSFLMLLKAAEFIDSRSPDVIETEHDYASSRKAHPVRSQQHPAASLQRSNNNSSSSNRSNNNSNNGGERNDRRDRLRPRPSVKRCGHRGAFPYPASPSPSSSSSPFSSSLITSSSSSSSPYSSQYQLQKKPKRDDDYLPRSEASDQHRRRNSQCSASVRSTHNQLEKIRRHYMRNCFDQLRETIFSTLHDQRQRGKSRSTSPFSSSSSSFSSSSPSSAPPSFATSGPRASSQQILNMAYNLIKDLQEESRLLEEQRWSAVKQNASLKRRLIGFQSIVAEEKVTSRSRSAETNCSSSGRSSYNSSPEFIDVISDSSSTISEDSGFGVSPK